jgi:hypothetical protein
VKPRYVGWAAVGALVAFAACASGDEPSAFDRTLTRQEIAQVDEVVDADEVLRQLVGANPTPGNNVPWTNDGSLVGVVTTVVLPDGPRDVEADLRGSQCLFGRTLGGVYRTEATNVSALRVWVDLNRMEVVAIHPMGDEAEVSIGERIGDAYYPDGACQSHD